MAGNIKINPDMAAQLVSTFRTQQAALQQLTQSLSSAVVGNVGDNCPAWEGRSATQFADGWAHDFRPALERLGKALEEAGNLLNHTIEAFQSIDS